MNRAQSILTFVVAVMLGQSVLSQEKVDSSAVPSIAEAEKLIAAYDNAVSFEVDGKKTVAIPKPDFEFPEVGTPIKDTKLKIGQKLELSGNLLNGDKFTLKDSPTRTATLVVFWSTSCGACLSEFPVEKAFYVKYKDRGLRIVSVNGDATVNRAQRTKSRFGLPWPTLFDGKDGPIVQKFGVSSWPTLLLLDHERKILHSTYAGKRGLRNQTISIPNAVYQKELTMSLAKLFPETTKQDAAEQ